MKSIKRGIAVLLAALLLIPNTPVRAGGSEPVEDLVPDAVQYNTGNGIHTVTAAPKKVQDGLTGATNGNTEEGIPDVSQDPETVTGTAVDLEEVMDNGNPGQAFVFAEDGSYTIKIPEKDPFFPYEVQFTHGGNIINEWFMNPEDSVEIGGHTFYVEAEFTGTAVTQMSFDVAGDTVVIYPEKKEFPDKESAGYSLLPLQEKNFEVDLTGYTPIELSMVKIADIFVGHEEFTDMDKIMWSYGINGDDFTISTSGDTVDMNGSSYYQMIVGKDDQLDSSNIRYMISVDKTSTYKWLIPSIYVQKEDGERREIIISRVYYSADSVNIHFSRGGLSESDKIHIGLALNTEVFQNPKFDHVRAFEGRFKTLDEALLGNDITDQVWEVDMSQKDSGYWMKWEIDRDWSYEYITLVTFDAEGNATGFVSVDLTIWGDKIDWGDLQAVIYTQDEEGNRDMITINSNSYSDNLDFVHKSVYVPENKLRNINRVFVGFQEDSELELGFEYDHIKFYEGKYESMEEALAGKEITDQIWGMDMGQKDAGYLIEREDNRNFFDSDITMVIFDAQDKAIWFQSINFKVILEKGNLVFYGLKNENGEWVSDTVSYNIQNNIDVRKITLYAEYKADQEYFLRIGYQDANKHLNSELVLSAYVGNYVSDSEALAAGAKNIKEELFGLKGYRANYSQTVFFTVFVKNDEGAEAVAQVRALHFGIQVKDGNRYQENLSDATWLRFYGLIDAEGNDVACYVVQEDEDSYAEYNFLTILVDGNVDLSKLAPKFSVAEDSHLYTTGSSTPEESGKSYHDFSRGPLQYTVSAEDGKSSKNYWLQILSPVGEEKFLYVNSLADPGAKAEGIYSTREVMIDSYHDNVHDILLINMGSEAINGAAVELVSDVVELDDYWTLKGELDLAGFDGVECAQLHGELGNMAKLRLRVKEGVRQGSDISGTLKIKSLTEDLLVFNLTGTIGNPGITTLEIPEAVKYVPYGTMIQNNNKYSWNRVSYSLSYGKLPEGMILKPNGEIYGVPKESGRFTFGVLLQNSGGFYNFGSHSKSFTLVVNENTNENVENATDTGYDVTTRIKDLYVNEKREDQLFVSEGIFSELVDVYLDGEKLVAGTDYRAESGSTRITIMAETLDSGLEEGTHTLGVEFRSGEDDSLKKAAQNFSVVKRSSTGGYPGGSTGGSSGSSGGDTIVTPAPTPTAEPTATTEPTATPKPTTTPKPTSTPKPTKAPKPSAAPSPLVTPKPVEEVDAGIPFIKGDKEFAGWDAIRELLKKASKGDDVVVDMNDSTLVPGEIIEAIRGKDVNIEFEMDREIAWEINGESVTSDDIPDIDFGVSLREDANEIPVEIVNKITGERYFVNMTLSHSGEFGFTAVLCINLGKENAGLYANLFYYLEDTGEMEFICADKIDKAGNARLRFTHASDYIIVVDNKIMDGVKQDGEKEDGEKNNSAGVNDKDLPKTALKDSVWFLFAGMLIILLGGAVFLVAYDKKYRNS